MKEILWILIQVWLGDFNNWSQNHGWYWFVEIFPAPCQKKSMQEKQAYVL